MQNTPTRYGLVSKALHWMVFLLILNQFVVAAAMMNTPQDETFAGFTPGGLYNWHKSIGLVALAAALLRFIWRASTPLPDWAPNVSDGEKVGDPLDRALPVHLHVRHAAERLRLRHGRRLRREVLQRLGSSES